MIFRKRKMRGDYILESEKDGTATPEVISVLAEVRRHGAIDEDIREWWNMPDEQHREIIEEHEVAKIALYGIKKNEGMSEKEAANFLKKNVYLFLVYQTGHSYANDDPLPYELKPRLNRFFLKLGSEKDVKDWFKKAKKSTTVNAYIRAEIRAGRI